MSYFCLQYHYAMRPKGDEEEEKMLTDFMVNYFSYLL